MDYFDAAALTNTLRHIKERFGIEPFLKQNRIIALFSDLAPSLENERIMLNRMSRLGILEDFALQKNPTKADQERIVMKSVSLLTQKDFIMPEIARAYIKSLVTVFEWSVDVDGITGGKHSSKSNSRSGFTSVVLPCLLILMLILAFTFAEIKGYWDELASCIGKQDSTNNQSSAVAPDTTLPTPINVFTSVPLATSTQHITITPTPKPADTLEPSPTPKPVMPNLLGRSQSDAVSMLNSLGIDFQVWWYGDDIYSEPYYVIDQSISEGKIVGSSTTVELQLSSDANQRYIDHYSWCNSDDWASLEYWSVHPVQLDSYYRVRSFQLTLYLDNIDFSTGTPYGDWGVYVHKSFGDWVKVKTVYVSENVTSIFVRFNNSSTIDGIVMERLSSDPCDHSLWFSIDLFSITN